MYFSGQKLPVRNRPNSGHTVAAFEAALWERVQSWPDKDVWRGQDYKARRPPAAVGRVAPDYAGAGGG